MCLVKFFLLCIIGVYYLLLCFIISFFFFFEGFSPIFHQKNEKENTQSYLNKCNTEGEERVLFYVSLPSSLTVVGEIKQKKIQEIWKEEEKRENKEEKEENEREKFELGVVKLGWGREGGFIHEGEEEKEEGLERERGKRGGLLWAGKIVTLVIIVVIVSVVFVIIDEVKNPRKGKGKKEEVVEEGGKKKKKEKKKIEGWVFFLGVIVWAFWWCCINLIVSLVVWCEGGGGEEVGKGVAGVVLSGALLGYFFGKKVWEKIKSNKSY